MIRKHKELLESVSVGNAIPMVIVNPVHRYILDAIHTAEERGWINPVIIRNDDDSIAARDAVDEVRRGNAKLLMKGDVSTDVVLKAVLNRETGIRTGNRLSHIAVVESPFYPKLMLMTDGGVNPFPDEEIFTSIINNSLMLANKLGIGQPCAAMLSLVEKVNDKLPETVLACRMAEKFTDDSRLIIEGPVALDVALSEKCAEAKRISSRIAGKTDIFIGPQITTVNFLVKGLMSIGGSKGGGIIMGAAVPIVLLSRSDTMETKLNSIALGVQCL